MQSKVIFKGAFTFDFDLVRTQVSPPPDCVHIILFVSDPVVYPCCLVTTKQERAARCMVLLTSLLYLGF